MTVKVICEFDEPEFERQVNRAIADGFEPKWETYRVTGYTAVVQPGIVRNGGIQRSAQNHILMVKP